MVVLEVYFIRQPRFKKKKKKIKFCPVSQKGLRQLWDFCKKCKRLCDPHLVFDPFHYWCGNRSACSLLRNLSCFCEHLLGTFNLCRSRYQFFQLSGHTNTKNIFTYCRQLGEIVHKVGPLMLLCAFKTCPDMKTQLL